MSGDDVMARVEHSERISTDGWAFGFGDLDKAVSKAVDEALETSLTEDPPELWLPFQWGETDGVGGGAVDDPLTIYMNIRVLSERIDFGPLWKSSIGALVDDCLAIWRSGFLFSEPNSPLHTGHIADAIVLRDSLRTVVDKLDAEIARAQAASENTP